MLICEYVYVNCTINYLKQVCSLGEGWGASLMAELGQEEFTLDFTGTKNIQGCTHNLQQYYVSYIHSVFIIYKTTT